MKTGNAKVTCVNPINLAAEELYNCAGEGDRAVQCTSVFEFLIESIMRIMKYVSCFHLTLIPHSFVLLVIGGATIQIGRAQECCEGYICEPGNVKLTCTKKENVAMEDLRVCAAEVRGMYGHCRQENYPGCISHFHMLTMFLLISHFMIQ